ncbi:MAG: T9SS type A sorting domain-containing protein [Bacteroidota bacterium]
MDKIILIFALLLCTTTAIWAQPNEQDLYIYSGAEVLLSDTNSLVIRSDVGWNLCAGGEITLYTNYASEEFEWLYNGVLLDETSAKLRVQSGGRYQVRVWEDGVRVHSEVVEVAVHQLASPVVTYEEHLLTSSEARAYQWYKDGIPIADATEQFYYPLESGVYFVEITDDNDCMATSSTVELNVASIHEVKLHTIETYPSPTRSVLYITPVHIDNQNYTLSLFSQHGQLVKRISGRLRDNQQIELDLQSLPQGGYLLQFSGEKIQIIQQVIKG